MTYNEVVTALVALLAVVISLVSLKRTSEFNKRQLEMQEETTRLNKIQQAIIEREETAKRDAAQKRAEGERNAAVQEEKAARLKAARRAQGEVSAFEGRYFNIPSIALKNRGYVPVREVNLLVAVRKGQANPLLESYLSAALPVKELAPGEEISIAIGTSEDFFPNGEHVFLLKWLSPSGELIQRESTLPIYSKQDL
jgi:hypothetical protein